MVLQGMPIDSNELREFSYGFFANVAEVEKVYFFCVAFVFNYFRATL